MYETYHDRRYAGRLGRVAAVIEERDESYPRGRVGVTLVYDELVKKLFGGPAPDPVWFGPTHLDKP